MKYLFKDVLEIKNGQNQRAVENSEGRYPIYCTDEWFELVNVDGYIGESTRSEIA